MSKPDVTWKDKPEAQDFQAAQDYLSLISAPKRAQGLVDALRRAHSYERVAKDLLRASALPLLEPDEPHVAADLKKIRKGKPLSPVLLVRGNLTEGVPLTIADGYHRVCAACHYDENAPIRCRIA